VLVPIDICLTTREITELDLNALREPIVKDFLESKGVPAHKPDQHKSWDITCSECA
jgi:hypothetical protein